MSGRVSSGGQVINQVLWDGGRADSLALGSGWGGLGHTHKTQETRDKTITIAGCGSGQRTRAVTLSQLAGLTQYYLKTHCKIYWQLYTKDDRFKY